MVHPLITLYPSTEEKFEDNGLGSLAEAVTCVVTEGANAEFELEMTYPINGRRYLDLKNRRIIYTKPNPIDPPQAFRIYEITKPMKGVTTVYASHISYDLSGYPVKAFEATGAVEALSKLKANAVVKHPFEFWTDMNSSGEFSLTKPVSTRSALGGMEGSILDIYHGEYKFDNFLIRLYANRGEDRGVSIRYGKNLTDFKQEENCSAVYTGVLPYWESQDSIVALSEPIPAEGTYDFTNILILDLSSEFEDPPYESDLEEVATVYMEANDIGKPKISIDISFAQLEQTDEYKNIALLERVQLFDTVTVEFQEMGVSATAKVNKTVYNCLTGRYTSVSVGDVRANITDSISDQREYIDEQIQNSKSDLEKSVERATQWIVNGRGYMVAVKNENGDWMEICSLDTPNIDEALHVWRWNNAGFGYSSEGYNGPYRTAITQDGHIVADFIDTGTFTATLIKTGVLQSKDGGETFYLDLDNGILRFNADSLDIKGKPIADHIEASIKDLSSLYVFLSNEYEGVLTDNNGNYGASLSVDTTISASCAGEDVTAECILHASPSSGVTGGWDSSLRNRYIVTKLTTDEGYVDFTVSYKEQIVTKRFNIAKVKNGADGTPKYTWLKYANNTTGSGMSDSPTGKTYMGLAFNKDTPTESTDYRDYQWSLIKGTDGVPGSPGKDGKTLYTWIKYAENSFGGGMSDLPDGKTYIGIAYNKETATESTNYRDYEWAKIEGPQGAPAERIYIVSNQNIITKRVVNGSISFTPNAPNANSVSKKGSEEEVSYYGNWQVGLSTDGKTFKTVIDYSGGYTAPYMSYSLNTSNLNNAEIDPKQLVAVQFKLLKAGTHLAIDAVTVPVMWDSDDTITREGILDTLAPNGEIYIDSQTGNLYISWTAAKGGLLIVGGKDNGNGVFIVRDANNTEVGRIDNTGANLKGNLTIFNRRSVYRNIGKPPNNNYVTSYQEMTANIGYLTYAPPQYNDGYTESNLGFQIASEYDQKLMYDTAIDPYILVIPKPEAFGYSDGTWYGSTHMYGKGEIQFTQGYANGKWANIRMSNGFDITVPNYAVMFRQDDIFSNFNFLDQSGFKDAFTIKRIKDTYNGMYLDFCGYVRGRSGCGTVEQISTYGEVQLAATMSTREEISDVGNAYTNEDGECVVFLDDIFENVTSSVIEYQVFLQKEGPGDIWVEEKTKRYFVVKGTANLRFAWRLIGFKDEGLFEQVKISDILPKSSDYSDIETLAGMQGDQNSEVSEYFAKTLNPENPEIAYFDELLQNAGQGKETL